MNDLETKRRWKNSSLRISTCWSELREVLSLWLFHANSLSLVLVVPFWSRLFFLKLTLTFLISIGQFPFQSHTETEKYKRKIKSFNTLFLFLSLSSHLCLENMLSTIRLVFFYFFLHFEFLSWHSSRPFQVSRDSWLITHGSSLMAHVFHTSWLLAFIKTLGSPHDSWLPLMTPGSPHDSWFPSWLLAFVFFNCKLWEPCSFTFLLSGKT